MEAMEMAARTSGRRPRGGRDRDTTAEGAAAGGFEALRQVEPEDLDSRAQRKRQQIQRAAIGEFLRNGYLGTSMDDVAAAASVSKQTVYKHFGSKEDLFLAIAKGSVGAVMEELFHRVDLRLGQSGDLEHDLRQLGRRLIELVMHPELLALRRLVIGEANRFPQLGEVWWQGGAARVGAELAPHLTRLAQAGELDITDPSLAAQQFNWLVLSIPLNQAMFDPHRRYTRDELHHHADAGVRTFLAAYHPR
jgi:AcrR family transcriptional regulator